MYSARTGLAHLGFRLLKKGIKRAIEKIHALTDRAGTSRCNRSLGHRHGAFARLAVWCLFSTMSKIASSHPAPF